MAKVNKLLISENVYSHGPQIELYLAEEAIGLVRSLDWEVAKGPLWREELDDEETKREQDRLREQYGDEDT